MKRLVPLIAVTDAARNSATVVRSLRFLGAAAILAVGLDHYQQYSADFYSMIPTIGTLFLLNFVSAAAIALGLVAPIRRVAGRFTEAVRALLALGGIAVAAGSLAGLLISENGGLFGFAEVGYRQAIVVSIVFEATAIVLLGAFLAANRLARRAA